jgi:hypothetical protein
VTPMDILLYILLLLKTTAIEIQGIKIKKKE